ncbi:hypothetical protein X975_03510, partial [Stegodyphus mimosarum]
MDGRLEAKFCMSDRLLESATYSNKCNTSRLQRRFWFKVHCNFPRDSSLHICVMSNISKNPRMLEYISSRISVIWIHLEHHCY